MAIPGEPEDGQLKVVRERRKCEFRKMIGDYIDTVVRIVITISLADLLQRVFLSAYEYIWNPRFYLPDERFWTILRRTHTYSNKHVYLMLAFGCLGLARFGVTGNLKPILPSAMYLACMPLYWLFNDLGESTLSYANWVRDTHGLDYASGMASSYFHGYLNLALPDRSDDGLQHRMRRYEDSHNVTFGVHRLIILIPDEMWVGGRINSDLLEPAQPLETININRAGVKGRPYKIAVYRLNRKINGKYYYFALEGATPMLSFFESIQSNLSATWYMRELKREIWLKFSAHLKNLLTTWPETRGKVELLMYNSLDDNGNAIDVGELVIAQMEKWNKTKKVQ
ncbi:uncharacterized protein Dwil_GK20640 [Drosophila willistoni]|uniref:Uncharacterized protein n=1 Tax=Drosophila willistoni TaxID=7260 RepID=B4MKB3_DROWI|nr:uncharacterized protein LOC6638479 [Drosophila willistoni]EDW72552.2 uncharacterized protein Dwil_GK20640 [Drosophila willistoni]